MMSARAKQIVDTLLEDQKTIAVDLDGTLARLLPGDFDRKKIGKPVPKMVRKVRRALDNGHKIIIFTARASEPVNIKPVKDWLKDNDLPDLKVTHEKTPDMDEFWDDKAKGVKKNEGTFKR
jgi:hypothetical protein